MAPEPLSLPESDWKGWLEDRARGQLRHAGDAIAALKDATPEDEAILQVWNDAGIALRNAAAACSLLSVVHPDPAVIGLAEQIELEVQAFRTDLFLDADVFAQLGSRRRPAARRRRPADARRGAARLPAGRRRPRRGDPRTGPHARPAADRPRPGVRPQHPRRASYDAGARRRAGRAARGLRRRAPAERGRAGRDHHGVPGPDPVPHVRSRRRRPPPGRAQLLQPRLAGERRRPRGAARDPAREGHACSATRAGPTTTPRPR